MATIPTSATTTASAPDIAVVDAQPDWTALNRIGAAFLASAPLSTTVANVTPPNMQVHIAVRAELADVLRTAGDGASAGLIIAVDTLVVPSGTTTIPGVLTVVARSVQVSGSDPAVLAVADAQLLIAEVRGSLEVAGAVVTAQTAGVPEVVTVADGTAVAQADSMSIADVMHSPWSVLQAELAFAAASYLNELGDATSASSAMRMMRFTTATLGALTKERASFSDLDIDEVASLQSAASALLVRSTTNASGDRYVPVLSADLYNEQIKALLSVADVYETKIAALRSQENHDQLLAAFATTLSDVQRTSEAPLVNTLERLANQVGQVQTELGNAAARLDAQQKRLEPLQEAFQAAVEEKFQDELLEMALEILFSLAKLYIGAAALILDNPEILEKTVTKQLAKAAELVEKLIEGGEGVISAAIGDGSAALADVPSQAGAAKAADGAEAMMGSVVDFGTASAILWSVVNAAIAGGGNDIDFDPKVAAVIDKVPNLNGLSVGGLDPVAYWDSTVVYVQSAVKPYQTGSTADAANAYLEAMELTATYGRSVGDLTSTLLDLYNQGVAAYDRLRAIHLAEQQWQQLDNALETDEAKAEAAIGMLERGYGAVKRDLVLAVGNFRSAFRYQWLQESSIEIDVSMSFPELAKAANNSMGSLLDVLDGNGDGTVRPRQEFSKIGYTVTPTGDQPLFSEVDGKGMARLVLPLTDTDLAEQVNDNTAIYLTEATFELVGVDASTEIELEISTSGHYENQLNGQPFRFVTQGVSMTSDYIGTPPRFITTWKFADEAAYLKPSPYTQWVLRVDQGDWRQASAIQMTVSGIFIQNG